MYQSTPLGYSDLEAWYWCIDQVEAVGFYNSDKTAGASQHHKHMQIVPLDSLKYDALHIRPSAESVTDIADGAALVKGGHLDSSPSDTRGYLQSNVSFVFGFVAYCVHVLHITALPRV